MGYKDDDIEFANRLLTRREELNDEEVTAWLKEKDHVELLDEIAAIRQKLSGQSYGENSEEEFLYLEKSIYDRKSRRMTLRWSIAASIILLVGLFVGRTISGVRDIHEEQELAKSVMQPGTSKAILMMADGKEVVLEQGQNLNILLNERVRVATSSQGIVYEERGKGMVTEEYNKLTTPIGGEYSLVLSDGTKVFLNADSELKYPVEFSDGKRIVDLMDRIDSSIPNTVSSDDRTDYADIIRENIGYDYLLESSPSQKGRINEIVGIMLDVVCSTKKYIRVNGEDFPQSVVKSQFLKLDSTHIEYVITALDKNTSDVRNIRAYLITALYNAPLTIDSFYSAMVNHDMYGSK